jgi:CelD/BcsL family acetyltransferase involved in cellulose biosynthesis
VYLDGVPQGSVDELGLLYRSIFSTPAWFRIFDRMEPTGACVLADPRHVIFFSLAGDTVEVLNKAFVMAPEDAARACRALFRALPGARRIHLEVMFPPDRLGLPLRVLYWADDMVIDLPRTADEYTAMLGKRTRKNIRNFDNRLRRECGEITTDVFLPGEELPQLFARFLEWHLASCDRRGIESGYVSKPDQAAQTQTLIAEGGELQVTSIGGRPAAVEFLFFIGDEATLYAGAYDPVYADLSLGFLSTYWAVCETIRRGARRCHLLWGTDYYKERLGAHPRRAVRLSVFRSQAARLASLDEAKEVAVRNLRRNGQREYWRTRHAVGRLVRGARARIFAESVDED